MNKRRYNALAILPLIATLAACATTATTTQTKTSLWEVSSAQRTVYLASDTQVLSASDYPLPAAFAKAFAASNDLYVEQIPGTSTKNQAKIHALIMTQGILPDGKTLDDVLTPTQLARIKAAAKKQGIAYSHIQRMRPWLLAVAWNGLAAATKPDAKHASKAQQQLSEYFYAKAKARSTPTIPFESYRKTFDIASALPMQAQAKWLMLAIKSDAAKKRALVKAWRAGDTATVLALSGSFKDAPKVQQAMVVDRNKTWVAMLEGKLRSQGKPIFVVVGDGHLMGEDTMLAMLRKDGFQVRQL